MPSESAYFIVENVDDRHSVKEIKHGLSSLHGIMSVSINPQTNLVAVDYDSSGTSYDKIENQINSMGFQIAADASNIFTR